MENRELKKKIYKKMTEDLNNLSLTSLEQEFYMDKMYSKLNKLDVEILLEFKDLQFTTLINNKELVIKMNNLVEINFHDLETINYRKNLVSGLKESVKDKDTFENIENLIMKTSIDKIKNIDINIINVNSKNNIIINDTLITRLKCDLLSDREISNTNSFKTLFNNLEQELNNTKIYHYITKINNKPQLYEQLLNHIKLKYIVFEFISNYIYNDLEYQKNKELYDSYDIDIQNLISKLGIQKLIILSNNFKYIPNGTNVEKLYNDLTDYIKNLLLENNENNLKNIVLYPIPKQENPLDKLLNNSNMNNKMKLIMAYAKYSQEIQQNQQNKSKKPVKTATKTPVKNATESTKYSPLEKFGITTFQHYFPNAVNINYIDNLKSNIIKGSLTGNTDKKKNKKWKNF